MTGLGHNQEIAGTIMLEFAGKTAFVTGGASGIVFALGRAFAEAGMKVMLADVEVDALAAAVKRLHHFGAAVRGVICGGADCVSVEHAAKASYEMSMWFATMPVPPPAGASTISRSTIGDGCST